MLTFFSCSLVSRATNCIIPAAGIPPGTNLLCSSRHLFSIKVQNITISLKISEITQIIPVHNTHKWCSLWSRKNLLCQPNYAIYKNCSGKIPVHFQGSDLLCSQLFLKKSISPCSLKFRMPKVACNKSS